MSKKKQPRWNGKTEAEIREFSDARSRLRNRRMALTLANYVKVLGLPEKYSSYVRVANLMVAEDRFYGKAFNLPPRAVRAKTETLHV